MTASCLIKVNLAGKVVDEGTGAGGLFRQGYVIHSAIHAVRHDALCVWHCHHQDTAAVAMSKVGVLPLSQEAIGMIPLINYHPFEGTANDMAEQERLQKNVGEKLILMLENHGPVTLGPSIEVAFVLMYNVCRSCTYQARAMALVGGDLSKLHVPTERQLEDMKARSKAASQGYDDGAGANASPELIFRAISRVMEAQYGVENIYC